MDSPIHPDAVHVAADAASNRVEIYFTAPAWTDQDGHHHPERPLALCVNPHLARELAFHLTTASFQLDDTTEGEKPS